MSGAGNHHADPLPDLRPPPRARKAARAWLAGARLRSTKLQRLTALGWALSFLRAPRHAGLRPPPGDTTFGSVDYRDPHIVLSECQIEAVRSGQQGCKHSVIGGITNGQTNKFRPVSPRGDQALEVIILGAQHEALIRSEIAQLRIRSALEAQQGDLAGSGKSIL